MLADIELCVKNYVDKTKYLGTSRNFRKESGIRIKISFTDVRFEPKYESDRTNVNIAGYDLGNATNNKI